MKKGVTLLETVVVIGLIAILSLFGVNTINNFRRDATLDNAANELISEIRVARSKSMNGEVSVDPVTGLSEEAEDFAEGGMPKYGIKISSDSYELIRSCAKVDGSSCASEPAIERVLLDDDLTLAPEGSFYFERVTGESEGRILTITEKKGSGGRKITITGDFVLTVSDL